MVKIVRQCCKVGQCKAFNMFFPRSSTGTLEHINVYPYLPQQCQNPCFELVAMTAHR
jgi:hypothetical protein